MLKMRIVLVLLVLAAGARTSYADLSVLKT